MFKPLSNAYLT
jgi:hypothetical protein